MTPEVVSADVERFRGIIAQRFGLRFDDDKLEYLADVLRRRAGASGERRAATYLVDLAGPRPSRDELRALAGELTVGETYFFRYRDHFRAFAERVLPERVHDRRPERRLRILSAGSASGEEAYSMAILVRERLLDLASWDVGILGIDVNPAMIARAASARYTSWSLRDTTQELIQRSFTTDGKELVLDPEVRAMASFEERNLVDDDPTFWRDDTFDIVFCRNVLMYLLPEVMQAVVARIERALVPGGFLFLGHAETLRGISQEFHLCHTHDTFYYRAREAREARPPRSRPHSPSAPLAGEPPASIVALIEPADSWVEAIRLASERIAALARTPGEPRGAERAEEREREPPARRAAAVARPDLGVAIELLRLERFGEAMDLLQALPPSEQADPDARLLRAVLLTNRGDLTAAEGVCEGLLEADELSAGPRYLMALCREHAGDLASAAGHDRAAAYLDPAFAMPRLHLGLLAKRAGDRDGARREFEQALALLSGEEPSRVLLFGGGFSRETLVALCRAELRLRRCAVSDGDRASELRRAFDAAFAAPPLTESVEHERLLLIGIRGDPYALRVAEIAGLAPCRRVVPVPSWMPELEGLAGVEGALVPVYGLAALLGYGATAEEARWLLLHGRDEPVGLAFADLRGLVEVPREDVFTSRTLESHPHVKEAVRVGEVAHAVIGVASVVDGIRTRARATG